MASAPAWYSRLFITAFVGIRLLLVQRHDPAKALFTPNHNRRVTKEKPERWTRWRAFAQVRHSSNIQLLPSSLVNHKLTGLVGDHDQVAAGVIEDRGGHRPHLRRLLGEPHAERSQPLVLLVNVVDGE
jgi:hypothetical protein